MDNSAAVDIIRRVVEDLDRKRGELTDDEQAKVREAAERDWPYGEPQ